MSVLTTWDPDGGGPQRELLVAGGNFGVAGDVFASHIAAWDGTQWRALGTGLSASGASAASVGALTVYDGALIAAGTFSAAGGVSCNNIARWDGAAWRPLGSGIGGANNVLVNALTEYNGELIAAGAFTTAGGVSCNNIARWNGSE